MAAKTKKPDFSAECITSDSKCGYEEGKGCWGRVVFSFRSDRFAYVWDKNTGDIYNDDSQVLIRLKCAGLVPRTLVQLLANVIYNIAKVAFREVPRAIYYGVCGVFAAAYGIASPYEGRKLYSMYERAYNREEKQVDRKNTRYVALCFVPLNYNAASKMDRGMSIQVLTRNILRNKYGFT